MGLLGKLLQKKSREMLLGAPVAGEIVALSEVSDPTFGEEILGKGVAIRPTSNMVVAPCDGTVDLMFDTGHAVSIKADCGAELLIHVGLETVALSGRYFSVHAQNGDHVKAGQPLIEFDREAIASAGFDVITPIVVCNSSDFAKVSAFPSAWVQEGDPVLVLVKL